MTPPPQNRWDERYSEEGYAYGVEPNEYLKEQLQKLDVGTILFPAEGEGRNAVYAAQLGWNVSAFDISIEGKKKALQLAEKKNVTIDYKVGLLPELNYHFEQFGALALIYAHFPPDIRSQYHGLLNAYLKTGGTIILEAFSKKNLEYRLKNEKIGGPKDLDTLFSLDEVKADFHNYEIIELVEKEVELNEGLYHLGKGSVIRFVGRKK
ncbi:MAG: class I SAM-dependent methyltransferase [Balneolaceae bacterium]